MYSPDMLSRKKIENLYVIKQKERYNSVVKNRQNYVNDEDSASFGRREPKSLR